MRTCISGLLGVELDQVSVKATTTEQLGFVGEKLGISAHAVVLLQRPE
jgi:2-C-methyl-D-erythritol 2,4-cyclodiphosphate synthase